ncbi:MAG: hypothetical protein LBJ36_03970 [Synergistaceae bacterium]|jgi:hypothetical protein|nr:hypothetical protein [Synergistaceae bacterium]
MRKTLVAMWEANFVEKRIAGIARWLDRCLKAYKTGALESALMDAECARADVELLRNEVWEKLEKQYTVRTRKRDAWLPAKVAFWAMTVVLAAATPVALLENVPRGEKALWTGQDSPSLEWVTPDEKTLLSNLRKHLSDANSFASAQRSEEKEEKIDFKPVTATAVAMGKFAEKPAVILKTPSPEPTKDSEGPETPRIPYDRILSLVRTGEKAMKQQESIIVIER